MTRKYFDGVVRDAGVPEPVDEELKSVVTGAREKVEACMEDFRIADALNELFLIFRRANKYIDETMPWALGKDETNQRALKDAGRVRLLRGVPERKSYRGRRRAPLCAL